MAHAMGYSLLPLRADLPRLLDSEVTLAGSSELEPVLYAHFIQGRNDIL